MNKTPYEIDWVCSPCGEKYGRCPSGIATWHVGVCGICDEHDVQVTEPRDFCGIDPLKWIKSTNKLKKAAVKEAIRGANEDQRKVMERAKISRESRDVKETSGIPDSCNQCNREFQCTTADENYAVCVHPDCPSFLLLQITLTQYDKWYKTRLK